MVKAQTMRGVSALLCESNIDPKKFYDLFDLNPSIENETNRLVPFKVFVKILETLQQQTSFNHPSIYLAKLQLQQVADPYFDLIKNAPNIDVALQIGKRFRYTYGETAFWHWSIEGEYVLIQRQSFAPLTVNDREHSLYSLAIVFLLLKSNAGEELRLKRVSLVQPEDKHKIELETFFNAL